MVVAQARHKKKPVKKTARSVGGGEPQRLGAPHPRPLDRAARRDRRVLRPGRSGRARTGRARHLQGSGHRLRRGTLRAAHHVARPRRGVDRRAHRSRTARVIWGVALGTGQHLRHRRPRRRSTGTARDDREVRARRRVAGRVDRRGTRQSASASPVRWSFCSRCWSIAIMIGTGIGLRALYSGTATFLRTIGSWLARWWSSRERPDAPRRGRGRRTGAATTARRARTDGLRAAPRSKYEEEYEEEGEYEEEDEDEEESEYDDVPGMESDWELPSPSLLVRTKDVKQDRAAIEDLGGELVEALARPRRRDHARRLHRRSDRHALRTRTRDRASRSRASRRCNKDIAYAMASPDVRILAPIPGRSAIGVEVPNRQRTLVALGDLLASEEAANHTHPLDVPIGRDISGKTLIANLGEMPHVLISGATGAGKSSLINSIVTSLVMRATPDRLRLMLVDPKRVEMGQYNDLPHLLAPVVVDPKKAAGMLAWAVKEMERRYDILAESGARDITSYQQMIARGELEPETTDDERVAEIFERTTGLESDVERPPGPEELPYIVIVVDELNDLMMVAARDVEESVVRIAQMARAVGIHLVLATQRPERRRHHRRHQGQHPESHRLRGLVARRQPRHPRPGRRRASHRQGRHVVGDRVVQRRAAPPGAVGLGERGARVVEAWRAQGGRRENVVALDVPAGRGGSDGRRIERRRRRDARARRANCIIRTQSGSTSMLQRKAARRLRPRRSHHGPARARGRRRCRRRLEGPQGAGDAPKSTTNRLRCSS